MTEKIDVEALRDSIDLAEKCRMLAQVEPATLRALLAAYKAHDAAVKEGDARTEERDAVEAPMTEICELLGLDDCDDAPGAVRRILAERDEARADAEKFERLMMQEREEWAASVACSNRLTAERDALKALIRETGAVTAPAIAEMMENIDTLKAERDEAKRELRKCTINKDELWKVVRADADKLRQAKEDGEDVAQMLVHRDKEADEQIAALTADRDALKAECETLEYKLEKATGPFGEFYKVNFAKIVDRLTASSDDPKLLADLLEERWNWESCCDELRLTLASEGAIIATLREALEPFNRDVRNGYPHNFSITVHGRNGEHVFGLLASDFDAVSAALNSARSK